MHFDISLGTLKGLRDFLKQAQLRGLRDDLPIRIYSLDEHDMRSITSVNVFNESIDLGADKELESEQRDMKFAMVPCRQHKGSRKVDGRRHNWTIGCPVCNASKTKR